MPRTRRFPSLFPAALAAGLAVAACAQPRTVCGEPGPPGAPPRIVTQDQELCDVVRLRTADALGRLESLAPERAELLRDATWQWADAATVDGFLRRVEADAGAEVAAAIRRAVEDVRSHSTRPVAADCAAPERCLVRGAALGARIAFDDAADLLRRMRRESNRGKYAGE